MSDESETQTHGVESTEVLSRRAAHPPTMNTGQDGLLDIVDDVRASQKVGNYRIIRSIGRGGMGEVFAARDLETDELVALKWFGRGRAMALHRFKREFRSVADLEHPNLVELGELVVLESGRAFFTMELLDGKPFHKYVRRRAPPGELPNMVRLRVAMRQLVAGLTHLHELGIVHRDLKPSNVLVTTQGRVVILDFGLVSEFSSNAMSLNLSGALVGTPSYIAPEHAARRRADKPADLYAVGVMLYQCLCGERPFSGSAEVVLARKQEEDAPDIDERVSGVPEPLARLCMQLLQRDPRARPTAEQVLAAFEGDAKRSRARTTTISSSSLHALPSRERVLEMLTATLEMLVDAPVNVRLRHASSSDKSLVLDRFFAELGEPELDEDAAHARSPMVLRARCLERESVPYKGIDQLVDALTLKLRNMDEVEVDLLEPRSVTPLLQMFPVLNSVWLPDSLPYLDIDRNEQRSFGVEALREVLTRAAERYQLVVCIEDFQWADADGAKILAELIRPPDAPNMLVIVTDGGCSTELLNPVDQLIKPDELPLLELELGPMSDAEARELAGELVGTALDELSPAKRDRRIERYVERAAGDPFFLNQIVVADIAGDVADDSLGELHELISRRVHGLVSGQRQALALLSALDGAGSLELLERCGLDAAAEHAAGLLEAKLLRDSNHDGQLEVAHHSIREITLAELEIAELRLLHGTISQALHELEDPRLELLAGHFEQAGELTRALDCFERAGDHAAAAFAFRRAAELYERALGLLPEPRARERERALIRKLAAQLVNAGKGVEAIDTLRELAKDSEPTEARAIQRQIADLYIQSGRISEGLAQIEPVFRALGERLPTTPLTSVVALIWRRLLLRLRGFRYTLRSSDSLRADELERLDTLCAVWAGLTHYSPLLAGMIHARYFRRALDVGEPLRLSYAFTYESVVEQIRGNQARSEAHMKAARELLAERHAPFYEAVLELAQNTRMLGRHEWREAARAWPEMIERLVGIPRTQHLRALAMSRYVYTLSVLGDLRTLEQLAPQWLQLTQDLGLRRDDAIIAAVAGFARLVLEPDDVGTQAMLVRARQWDAPGYTMPNFHIDLTEISRMMWLGHHEEALAAAMNASERAKRSRLTLFEIVRHNLADLRGRCCVLALSRQRSRAALLKLARAAVSELRRGRQQMYLGQAAVIEAGLATSAADVRSAVRHYRAALEAFDDAGMRGHAAAVCVRLAELERGASSELRDRALAYFSAQQILKRERFVAALAPVARG